MTGAGLFISFEGGEASGKSLQAAALADWLRGLSREVVATREPGGTALGERIRELLLYAKEVALAPETEALLFSAARAQLAREVIAPALAEGRVVVADRYFDSTLAYQGHGRGADAAGLAAVTRFAVDGLVPHLTFLLDVPVETSLARARARRTADPRWDRFEAGDRAFHQRLRDGYLRLAAAEPGRFRVVDGDRPPEVIGEEIRTEVLALLVPSAR